MTPRRWLLEAALLAYPADFRSEFREEMLADLDDAPSWLGSVADVIVAGLRMRAEEIAGNVTFGLRRLRKAPLFVAIVVATFALGIGANIAVFSVLKAVLLQPLPYPNAARLVVVAIEDHRGVTGGALSIPDVGDLRESATQFEAIAAEAGDSATLTGSGKPHSIDGMDVTWNFFDVLGIHPVLGRFFLGADAQPGKHRAIVSERLWRTRLHSDPDIVGKFVRFDDVPVQIVGVAPDVLVPAADSGSLDRDDFWMPLPNLVAPGQRGARYLGGLGLLKPGANLESAATDLSFVSNRLTARYPRTDTGLAFVVHSMNVTFFGNVTAALWTLFAAVIGILLVTCANVTSLILTNASTRDREFALRASLGASGRRLGLQLLIETAMLAGAGGVIGVALAYVGMHYVVYTFFRALPRIESAHIDGVVLLYAMLLVVVVTIVSGLWPLATLRREQLTAALNAGGRSGDRSSGARTRSLLVVFEIAVALALVFVSGLMIRSLYSLTHVDLGVRTAGLVVSDLIDLPSPRYDLQSTRLAFTNALLERIRAIPGVRDAALSISYPLSGVTITFTVGIVGKAYPNGSEPDAHMNAVTPGYFTTLSIPAVHGRTFTDNDRMGTQPVAIVNDAFVKRYLSDRAPIGTLLRTPGWNGAPKAVRTIVGVVADERQRLTRPAPPMFYVPANQLGANILNVVVRSDTLTPTALDRELDRVFSAVDPLLEAPKTHTIVDLIDFASSDRRAFALLLGALALAALLLALSGVFGVMSFNVTQRSHEFGVRRAIGASHAAVLGDVLGRALVIGCVGVGLGSAVAALGGRVIASQLYGVSPLDPFTFAIVIPLFLGCVCLAAFLPAIRAMRVDPSIVLRHE